MVEEEKLAEDMLPEEGPSNEEPVPEEPKPEFLTRDGLDALLEQKIDPIRRQFQSVADRQISEAKKRADEVIRQAQAAQQAALSMQQSYIERLKATDPLAASQLENQMLRSQISQAHKPVNYYEEEAGRMLEEFGLSRDDPRIDWALDELNPIKGWKRFEDSINNVRKQKATSEKKPDIEAKGPGVEIEEDATPPKKKPEAPPVDISTSRSTKTREITRKELSEMSLDEYTARRDEINKAFKEGRIK